MVVPANLRRQVIKRAANCCEYCGLAQTGQEATFHVDHVVPVVAGGQSTLENLALACVSCSLRKSARLVWVDPHTGEEAILFDPRRDVWRAHFRWDGVRVVGITPTGRANGHGATHEPSAGLGNPVGGRAARKTPAANTSIRVYVAQVAALQGAADRRCSPASIMVESAKDRHLQSERITCGGVLLLQMVG
jgi:HNH endonuclease